MANVREDAMTVIQESIKAVLPDVAVRRALDDKEFNTNVYVIAIGKAAWNMAKATSDALGNKIVKGLIITKYDHSKGDIEKFEIIEAGHPIPDENSAMGAQKALDMVKTLSDKDQVIFLISGGGSALFEKPLEGVSLEDIMDVTDQLLGCGADIVEINTVRKHLSAVKGGRFALACGDAKIYSIILSDVLGDHLDSIASGPAYPDCTTSDQAMDIIEKYGLQIEDHLQKAIMIETPKEINNCESYVTGSVTALCKAAAESAKRLGYKPLILSSSLDCEAKDAGRFMASIIKEAKREKPSEYAPKLPCAIIAGGETVVRIMGKGKGGRNQEAALAAAIEIESITDSVFFSLGSDGTDGPTDAAGGIVDGKSAERIRMTGIMPEVYLDMNDSYTALKAGGDLIITGATGTNVNDVMVALCK
ncbi:glycerate kinase type-2 family protein [Alkalibacter mobilis]|uniref:glycerate kinase type-2 family protein n=1 Tax=Alkalibacter mobilis TaxID=2787712 RepID=UPI00189D69C5|nr:glycerate kinase [Alkalibacter mobilis]MBF7096636.1 glycerate kinase [Alkalibacter mobilis]